MHEIAELIKLFSFGSFLIITFILITICSIFSSITRSIYYLCNKNNHCNSCDGDLENDSVESEEEEK